MTKISDEIHKDDTHFHDKNDRPSQTPNNTFPF